MDVNFIARVRRVLEGLDALAVDASEQATMSGQGELLTAAGAVPYRETVRSGRTFYTGTLVAIPAVVAIPTTAVLFALYNNDVDGSGRSLVIDWVAASGVAKTAAAGQAQLLVNPGQARETPPTDAALAIKKANGNTSGSSGSVARTILNATPLPGTTGVQGQWIPLGPAVGFPGAGATPGHGLYAAVDGRFIVPPGRYFGMHVLADVVGSTFQGFIGWHELPLVLG